MRWMNKNTPAVKVSDAVSADGSRGRVRPRFREEDQVKKYLVLLGTSN